MLSFFATKILEKSLLFFIKAFTKKLKWYN